MNGAFRRFLPLTVPHRRQLAAGAGLILMAALLTLPGAWLNAALTPSCSSGAGSIRACTLQFESGTLSRQTVVERGQ